MLNLFFPLVLIYDKMNNMGSKEVVCLDSRGKDKNTQEYRKKRIKRIKRGIVVLITACIVIPTIVSIILMFRIRTLEQEIRRLSDTKETVQGDANVVKAQVKSPKPSQTPEVTDEKKVYLTFEDGPSQQTERILDVLKNENVKATFFVIGHTDSYSKRIYRRIVDEGHTLGMHSFSHIYNELYKSEESFTNDLVKLQDYLQKVTGVTSMVYRFPGGSGYQGSKVPMKQLFQVLQKKGISYYDWNVVNGDNTGKQLTKQQMIDNVLKGVEQFPVSMVQMHDASDKRTTADSIKELIHQLQSEGYSLLPIDEDTTPIRHAE